MGILRKIARLILITVAIVFAILGLLELANASSLTTAGTTSSGINNLSNDVFGTSNWSVSFWMMFPVAPASADMHEWNQTTSANMEMNVAFVRRSSATSVGCGRFKQGVANDVAVISTAAQLVTNQWYHVMCLWDGSSLYAEIDSDAASSTTGVPAVWGTGAVSSTGFGSSAVGSSGFSLGFDNGNAGSSCCATQGQFRSFIMWNTNKTMSYLQQFTMETAPCNDASIVRYYPLDEGTGATAHDCTTNADAESIGTVASSTNFTGPNPPTTGMPSE